MTSGKAGHPQAAAEVQDAITRGSSC